MTFRASPHSLLAGSFSPLLEKIRTFQEESIAWMKKEKGPERDAEAARLKKEYSAFTTQFPMALPDQIDEAEADRAFAAGVMRALELEGTIRDEMEVVDTYNSSTLPHFSVDFRNDIGDKNRVREALLATLNINEGELNEIEENFRDVELRSLETRKTLIRAIDSLFDLHGSPKVDELFNAFYPDFPLPDTKIEIVRTATSIFFCVPFASVSHLSIKEGKLSDDSLSRLWGNFSSQKQAFMSHFPVFGFFKGDHVDSKVLATLATQVGISEQECQDLLTTMISILPAEEVDKYIIHDIWGHQWQAHLFSFEDTYSDTADFYKVPDLFKEMNGSSIALLLKEGLKGARDDSWKKKCEDHLMREYEERIIYSISALFAEVLADAMEYKFLFLRPDLRHEMPSSSFLAHLPAKLDLTLHDLPVYFRLALRGIKALEKPANKTKLSEIFLKKYPESDPKELEESVNAFTNIANDLIASEAAFEFEDFGSDEIIMNAHAQLAFQFFELVEAYNEIFLSPEIHDTTSPVFARHFDLLVFSSAAFYERKRQKHFWEIDSFVRNAFPPRYKKLQSYLSDAIR